MYPAEQMEDRMALWAVIFRAIQDKVFDLEKGEGRSIPVARPTAPVSPWVKNTYVESEVHVPFYAVRANRKKSFRDPTKVYGHRQVNWSYRWSVTGHWRHYKDGRKIWIGSYVKGPEDKPLIPSVRVYAKDGPGAAGSPGWLRRVWRRLVSLWPGS